MEADTTFFPLFSDIFFPIESKIDCFFNYENSTQLKPRKGGLHFFKKMRYQMKYFQFFLHKNEF